MIPISRKPERKFVIEHIVVCVRYNDMFSISLSLGMEPTDIAGDETNRTGGNDEKNINCGEGNEEQGENNEDFEKEEEELMEHEHGQDFERADGDGRSSSVESIIEPQKDEIVNGFVNGEDNTSSAECQNPNSAGQAMQENENLSCEKVGGKKINAVSVCIENEKKACGSNDNTDKKTSVNENEKEITCCCSGHRRTIVSDTTISDLDTREEIISTMLAYLELHSKTWLRMWNPLRSTCVIKCYGGPVQFQMLAKRFPPVAVTLRHVLPHDEVKRNLHERRQLEFDFVRTADVMCWDVLTVLRELKALQWNMAFALDAASNTTGNSGIIVETANPSFHFTTASNIDDDARDDICDFLHGTVMDQEETRVLQLDALYCVLKELSCKTYDRIPTDRRCDAQARQHIGQFFLCQEEQQKPFLRELITSDLQIHTPLRRWNAITSDIRDLVNSYPDVDFNGRSVARIFQGIESPRFPAIVYGRDRRFWRQYLDVDFNELRKFSIRELARV